MAQNKDLESRLDLIEHQLKVLQDKEEIRLLKARYCHYADGGWPEHGPSHMGPVADLFVEDGVWDASPGMPAAHGREAIRRLFEDFQAIPFVIHNAVNPMIEVNGDEATGHWHFIGCGEMPGGEGSWFIGTYDERYVRTSAGWRFRLMRYTSARQAVRPQGWGAAPGQRAMAPNLKHREGA